MINQNFIYLSLIFGIVGYGGYIVNTYRGKTKPNRVSWSFWALAALVTLLSQHQLHGNIQLLYTLMQVILPLSIFLVSFRDKNAYWKLTTFDILCGFIAFAGLALLLFAHTPTVSLWLGIFSDFAASIPTIKKCYTDPETESWKTYGLAVFSSLITVLTVKPWLFVNYSFAFYVLLVNILFTALIIIPKKKHRAAARLFG